MLKGFYKFTNLNYAAIGLSFNCFKEELQRSLVFIMQQHALETHPEALNIAILCSQASENHGEMGVRL